MRKYKQKGEKLYYFKTIITFLSFCNERSETMAEFASKGVAGSGLGLGRQ